MRTIAVTVACAAVLLMLNSCGECSCNTINKDYLRDVPVTKAKRFQ